VTLPDIRGREQILNVHMRKIPWAGREPRHHRRGTPGMSGPIWPTCATKRR
jgi:cell division protease FtsH